MKPVHLSSTRGCIMKKLFQVMMLPILAFSPAHAITEQARPADAFVESIGIGDRFDWLWNDGKLSSARAAIDNLHIRHLRVGIAPESGDPNAYIDAVKSMASTLNAKLCIQSGFNTWGDMSRWLDRWRGYNGTYAVEGPNESFDVPTWASANGWTNVLGVQQQLWNYAHPKGMEVYAWTLGGPAAGYYGHTTDGGQNTDDFCDYLNFHPYHWYTRPGQNWVPNKMIGLWQNVQTPGTADARDFTGCIQGVRDMTGNQTKPYVSTEWGWCTNGNEWGVGMAYAKKYYPRAMFEAFNGNVHRSFLFSLTEYAGAGADYGLANSSDGSLRENGKGVANTIALLEEPGKTDYVTGTLSYTVTIDNTTNGHPRLNFADDHDVRNDEIHHTLLQKSNGVFYLVLWSDYDSHDGEDGWSQNATLTLAGGAGSVKAYLPVTNGVSVARDYGMVQAGGTVRLDGTSAIPDHPLILAISPGPTSVGNRPVGKPSMEGRVPRTELYTLRGRRVGGDTGSYLQLSRNLFVKITESNAGMGRGVMFLVIK